MSEVVRLALIAAVSTVVTAIARRYAMRGRLVDMPGERRSHSIATPRGGGVGPVLGITVALLLVMRDAPQRAPFGHALAALLMVAAVGFWDDHRPLPASLRLVVHVAAAIVLASGLFGPADEPFAYVATVAGAVALTNVWNFMDGIDGIASSQAALVAGTAALLLEPVAGFVALAVAVACAAFLPFNFPRARIFMGDVGSGALGLALAFVWATLLLDGAPRAARLALPASAFLIDAGLTLGRRMVRRERWWQAHAQHLYQGLARRYGHPRVTIGYALWTAIAAGASVLLPDRPAVIMASLAVCYTTGAQLWFVLQRQSQRNAARTPEKDR